MDRPVVGVGFVAAGVALVGTLVPDAPRPAAVALAVVALLGYGGARYGVLDAKRGAAVGALGGTAVAAHALVLGSGRAALLAGAGGLGAAVAATFVGGDLRERFAALSEAVVVGLGGYLVLSLWGVFLLSGAVAAGLGDGPLVSTLGSHLAILLGALTTTGFYVAATGRGWDYVDYARPGKRDAVAFLAGAIGLGVVLFGYSALFTALGVETAEHSIADRVAGNPELLAVLVPSSFLLVGVGEELVYRNVVQKRLAEAFPDAVAVLLGSGVFAAAHLSAYVGGEGSLGAALLSVFTLALVLGGAYAYSRNVVVPVALHGAYDAVTFAAIAFGVG